MREGLTKASGLWEGVEVEHTQFYGLSTLFCCRCSAIERALTLLLCDSTFAHIYFDLTDLEFFSSFKSGSMLQVHKLQIAIAQALASGKKVTVNIHAEASYFLLQHFRNTDSNYCLLLTVVLPQPDLGQYALKIVPEVTFNEKSPYATGVWTAQPFDFRFTPWEAYSKDKDIA